MIFLPNFFERYTFALRCSIQKLTEKHGVKHQYLKMMKKIYRAEAKNNNEIIPINLYNYSSILLTGIYVKKINQNLNYSFNVFSEGNYLINIKAYTVLIMEAGAYTDNIVIEGKKDKIIITTNFFKNKENQELLNFLGGYFLREINGKIKIILPANLTGKREVLNKNIWDYLTEPFSEINVWTQ